MGAIVLDSFAATYGFRASGDSAPIINSGAKPGKKDLEQEFVVCPSCERGEHVDNFAILNGDKREVLMCRSRCAAGKDWPTASIVQVRDLTK